MVATTIITTTQDVDNIWRYLLPTYSNTTNNPFILNSPPLIIPAGQSASIGYYIKPNHLTAGVTKTSDEPKVSPWALLATITSAPSVAIDTSAWDQVIVHNASSDVVTISANGDDSNAMTILPATKEVLADVSEDFIHCASAHRTRQGTTLIGLLKVVSMSGTGSVFIYGYGVD